MLPAPDDTDIRAASCTITNRAGFLRQLQEIAADHDVHIFCFNADRIAGKAHAAIAVKLASRAFLEGANISNTIEMEALLYAAGSRQCNIAASFGIHEGENQLWICCLPVRNDCWAALEQLFRFNGEGMDETNPERLERLMEIFAISPEELEAAGGDARIIDLVLERVALLQVLR